ncbi:hypothetical protein OAF54_00215 [bacterium]|nr:hypothetical protein [bacterium]
MAYAPGVKARVKSFNSSPTPILGSGKLSPGTYRCTVESCSRSEDTITATFRDDMGDMHTEMMWITSKWGGYPSAWRNWLANLIPDLEAIKLWKHTLDPSGFVGATVEIVIGDSEGYRMVRDIDKWAASVDGEIVTEFGTVESVRAEMQRAGIPRSYYYITNVKGVDIESNIKRYISTTNKLHPTAAGEVEAPAQSKDTTRGDSA